MSLECHIFKTIVALNISHLLFHINLKDFFRVIPVNEDIFENRKGEAETLAGFILELLGNFPKKGQKIAFENCLFTIVILDKKRIKKIKVTIDG